MDYTVPTFSGDNVNLLLRYYRNTYQLRHIGSLLSPPAVRTFCFCTALALVFDWLLQLFMFAPVLICFYSFSAPTSAVNSQKYESAFATYAKWIQKRLIRYSFLLMLIVYWMASGFLALQMRENFSPEKTFDTNSYLAHMPSSSLWHSNFFFQMYFDHEIIRVFFTVMPEDTHELRRRMRLIDQIEYICDNFTTWIDEYDAIYGRDKRQTLQDHFANIAAFLVDRPDFTKLIEFDHTRWRERALMVRDLRSRLPEDLSIHIFDSAIFDLILSSREAVIKSVLVTVVCMVVLCALFIPTLRATSVAVTSVGSITIGKLSYSLELCIYYSSFSSSYFLFRGVTCGMIGGLYLWGADLDTMVMVDIVMAIGMTVDFSAHISYVCFINGSSLRESNKLAEVVQAVAFPTAQAALTTMACVVPLYFYRIYMYVTFAKTVILGAMIGFIHTVFVIPFLLSFLDDRSNVAIIRSPKHNGNRESKIILAEM
uniref:SSD domain-containing protein n=1 Tax=Parascaris equorum TaxID=6256 RepID=A0A914RXJ4_PAREQ